MDIPWQHEGSMLRSSAAGEALVIRGALHQLVAAFMDMDTEQQRGVAIRVAGPDWTREYVDEEIRELAARPEYGDAAGRHDTKDPDRTASRDEADPSPVEKGISGASRPRDEALSGA